MVAPNIERFSQVVFQHSDLTPYVYDDNGNLIPLPSSAADPFVTISPIGGGADDWPALNALMAANANSKAIYMLPGNYVCKTAGVVPSGTRLYGNPGVTITQTLPISPYSPLDAAFTATGVFGANTTIQANAAAGATSVSLVANIATVGQYIIISPSHLGVNAGLRSRVYQVKQITGAGPFAYKLDRPIRNNLVIGDSVSVATYLPQNIVIDGGGMTMSGVGQRFLEFVSAVSCTVKNIRSTASAGSDISFSFDIGGLYNTFENIYADGGNGLAAACIALESCERSIIKNCTARNSGAGVSGIVLYDSAACGVEDSYGMLNGDAGLAFVSDGNAPLGCEDCWVQGGDYSANTLYGTWVLNGSSRIQHEEVTANWNGANGFQIGDGVNASTNVTYSDCTGVENTSCGIGTQTPASRCYAENCDFSGNVVAMATLQTDFDFINCNAELPTTITAIIVFVPLTYTTRLINCTINSARVGGINNFPPVAGNTLYIDGCDIIVNSTGLVPNAGSVIKVSNTKLSSPTGGVSGMIVNGGTLRVLEGVDADGTTVPLAISSGACNRSTVQANGVTAVDVTWPDLKSTDRVQLTLKTKGGAPSAMPAITYTAASKFTLTSYAGDTSTYDYVVG